MNILCKTQPDYFIDDPYQPKLNNKEIRIYTDFIYFLKGYKKHQIKLFGLTIYTYYSNPTQPRQYHN